MTNTSKEDKQIKLLSKYNSEQRINSYAKYLKENNNSNLLEVYKLNNKAIVYFYCLLSNLEIVFRNKIINAISTDENKSNWYEELIAYFSLKSINHKSSDIVSRLIDSRREVSKFINNSNNKDCNKIAQNYTNNKVASFLTFGDWINILESYDNTLMRSAFTNIQSTETAKQFNKEKEQIVSELKNLRDFRNRCAHHESIIKNNTNKSLIYIEELITKYLTILSDKGYKNFVIELAKENSCTSFEEINNKRNELMKQKRDGVLQD